MSAIGTHSEERPSRGRWMRRVRRECWFRLSRTMFRLFRLILLIPSCGSRSADFGEKREPRETASDSLSEQKLSDEGLDAMPPR